MDDILYMAPMVALVLVLLGVFFSFVPVGLWITARFSGVPVKISDLVGMRLRRVTPSQICLLYTSPSPRDLSTSRMPSSA